MGRYTGCLKSRLLAFSIEIDNVTGPQWSALINDFEDSNIYQTWAYGSVRWGERSLSHLVLRSAKEAVAVAQLRIIRPALPHVGIAYLRWGPLCQRRGKEVDHEVVGTMAAALRAEYAINRGLYLEVLPRAFDSTDRAEIFESEFHGFNRKPGIGKANYRTLLLDLSLPLDEIRGRLEKKWRNQLNAATRNNLDIVERKGHDSFSEFQGLYEQMWRRKQFSSGVSVDEFLDIQKRLPEKQQLKILICRENGIAIAGLVCSELGDTAIYLLGATNERGMTVKASYLLQWTLIQSLKERGIRQYDLGGIDPVANPGVHHFKQGLSGTDMSHIGSLICCENPFSSGLVRFGRVLLDSVATLRHHLNQA